MKFTSFLNCLQLVVATAQQPARTKGMCFKKNRYHSIPALNLNIPLSIYHRGVDHALAFSLSRLAVKGSSGSLQLDCLDAHNQYRILAGLPTLTWDVGAQTVAQKWANHLASENLFEHSHTSGFGENLFKEKGLSGSCDYAIRSWFEEYSLYKSNSRIGSGNFEGYGHYTQLIWPSTTSVGCAQSKGRGGVTTVCEYRPPGNVYGQGVQKSIA